MRNSLLANIATLISGTVFGFGLAWATMIRPESVTNFLTFRDFGLLLVLGSATTLNLVVMQLLPRFFKRSALGGAFEKRPFVLDRSSLVGGALFGVGWGICGVCPGPAITGIGAGNYDLLIALAGIFVGALLHGLWANRRGGADPALQTP